MNAAHTVLSRTLNRDFKMELDAYYSTSQTPVEKTLPRLCGAPPRPNADTPEFDVDEAIAVLCGPPVVKPARQSSRSFRAVPAIRRRDPDPHKEDTRLPSHEKRQDYLYLNAQMREQVAFY